MPAMLAPVVNASGEQTGVHMTYLRQVRLPGLRSAEQVKAAAKILVDADWLRAPVIGFGAQSKVVYAINPRLWGQ